MLCTVRNKTHKENKKASTAKVAIWYTISNLLSSGVAFLTTPIFTRMMSKAEYGQVSNFLSWEGILAAVLTLNFNASIVRAKYDFDSRMDEYLSSIMLTSNIFIIIGYAVVELNSAYFIDRFSMDIWLIRMMFLYIFFTPPLQFLQSKHRIYWKYKTVVALSMLSSLGGTAISILLVMFMKNRLYGRIIGIVMPAAFLNLIIWISIVYKGRKLSFDCVKYAGIISIPLIPAALANTLLGNSDRVMITKICGDTANALYSLAYSVSMLASLLWTSMNQAWSPWLYDNINANERNAIWKHSKLYLGVFAMLIVGVFLISPEIILVLGGRGYYDARYVMPPVIMGCVFQFIYAMYVNLEIYAKKTVTISIGTFMAALLNIGLNTIFIPKYGYIAAAYTTMVGYLALFVFHYLIVRFTVKELSNLYDLKFIVLMIIGMTAVGGLSLLLYANSYVRYGVIVVYSLALIYSGFKYKDKIIMLLRR